MAGNIQKIPNSSVSEAPLGPTIKRFHEGRERLTDYVEKWKQGSVLPRVRSLDGQWNNTIVRVLGNLYKHYHLYNIDTSRDFDGKKVFTDLSDTNYWNDYFNRPSLLEEELFEMYLDHAGIQDSYTVLSTQVNSISTFTAPTTFLGYLDTPSSYTGHANKYVGIKENGTSLEFFFPTSDVQFISLSDTITSYPSSESVLVSDTADFNTKKIDETKFWSINEIDDTALITEYQLSGTQCDNVFYLTDVGLMANCTSFEITLGSTFDGARVSFKCTSGENTLTSKFVQGDTANGGSVSLMGGFISDYTFQPPYALSFVYSTDTESYYLTEQFEAF